MDAINRFYRSFFSASLPIKIRIFNIVFIGGTFTGVAGLLSAFLLPLPINVPIPATSVAVAVTLFMPIIFILAYITKKYDLFINIGMGGLNFIFFPLMFLTTGAFECGTPSFFLMGIFFTLLLIRNKINARIMLFFEILFYCFVLYIPELWPQLVKPLAGENFKYAAIYSDIVIVSLTIAIIGKMLISQFVRDKKKIDKLVNKLEDITVKDPLTDIFNRRYLMDFLAVNIKKSFDNGLPLTIIMFDIDLFKNLNDKYGHIIGDEILKKISAIFKNNLRNNEMASRYGGEEFIIVLPETDLQEAYDRAEQMRTMIEHSKISGTDISVTISGGIGKYVKGITPQELIDIADKNLYLSKQRGRNKITK